VARSILMLVGVAVLALAACKPNPADCYEKGDEKACNAICETGEEGALPACYELRARQVEACANGQGDCKAACDLWANGKVSEETRNIYVAKLGSDAKVSALESRCAAPGGAPAP